jgi:hypothetical protein
MKQGNAEKTGSVPFDDTTFVVGGLTVDSAEDRVGIFGSVDIWRDQQGLAGAKILAAYFASMRDKLQGEMDAGKLPEKIVISAPIVKANPLL